MKWAVSKPRLPFHVGYIQPDICLRGFVHWTKKVWKFGQGHSIWNTTPLELQSARFCSGSPFSWTRPVSASSTSLHLVLLCRSSLILVCQFGVAMVQVLHWALPDAYQQGTCAGRSIYHTQAFPPGGVEAPQGDASARFPEYLVVEMIRATFSSAVACLPDTSFMP